MESLLLYLSRNNSSGEQLRSLIICCAQTGRVQLMDYLLKSPFMEMTKYMDNAFKSDMFTLYNVETNTHITPQSQEVQMYELALLSAAGAGQTSIIQYFFDLDAKINWIDPKEINKCDLKIGRNTPFYMACQNNCLGVVEIMLKSPKIDVNAYGLAYPRSGPEKALPLQICCDKGFEKMVKLLLSHPQIDVNKFEPNDFYTPLICSVLAPSEGMKRGTLSCETGIVKQLLARPELKVNHQIKNKGLTALHVAAKGEDENIELFEITKCLLQHKDIDVDVPAMGGLTALSLASYNGWNRTKSLIIEHKTMKLSQGIVLNFGTKSSSRSSTSTSSGGGGGSGISPKKTTMVTTTDLKSSSSSSSDDKPKSEKVIAVNPKVRLQQLHKEFMAKGLDATAAAIASLKIMKEESGGGREKKGGK